jgi:hypothetical protein
MVSGVASAALRPNLNRIEMAFAKLEALLRVRTIRPIDALSRKAVL